MLRFARLPRRGRQLLLVVLLFAALGSVTYLHAGGDPEAVVSVNGQPVSREAFYQALERYNVGGERLGRIALRQLIAETLVLQANTRYNLGITDEMVAEELEKIRTHYGDAFAAVLQEAGITLGRLEDEIRIQLILERLMLQGVEVTEEQMAAFYAENKATYFTQPEGYRPSQILVKTREEAEEILAALADGASFAELRAARTLDDTDWGVVTSTDQLPKELADALFALAVGEVSEPIETADGFYIIRLEEITPARELPYDEVKEAIREHLLYSQARPVEEVIDSLWAEAQIDVHWERYKDL